MSLKISIRESSDVTILDLQGRVTIDNESELLDSELRALVARGVRKLLLNLTDLSQIDSSGISVIVTTCVSLRKQGGDLKLLRPRGHVLEVVEPLHLIRIIPSFEDESEAVSSFRPTSYTALN